MITEPRSPCWDGLTHMAWQYNDGGRSAAGIKGNGGDCVTMAIAIATQTPYSLISDALQGLIQRHERAIPGRHRSTPRSGVRRPIYERYLKARGWCWRPTMHIGTGCRVHFVEEELPRGIIIVRLSRHLTVIKNHVIHDTFNPSRGDLITTDGIQRISHRCVYGYFERNPS